MPRNKDEDDDDYFESWDGVRGITWERASRAARPWLSGVYVSATDDFNVWDAAQGTDMGGDAPGAPAIPAGPGQLGALGKRSRRQTKTWSILYRKFCDDEKIKNMLLALPPGDVPVAAGGARGIGRRAWLLLESQGAAPIDDEYIERLLTIFANCTILETVGFKIGTVSFFYRYPTPNSTVGTYGSRNDR